MRWINSGLIHGLGISYVPNMGEEFYRIVANIDNAIIHLINGLFTSDDIYDLDGWGFKLLILGYKDTGRGIQFYVDHSEAIKKNIEWTKNHMDLLFDYFDVVAFDNLAIKQLNVKDLLTDEEWSEIYSGDEGQFTYYIDLPCNTFSINSTSKPIGILRNNSDEMFNAVRKSITETREYKHD